MQVSLADNPSMLIREEATTRATPEQVWAMLCDPARHGSWNPRITGTEVYGSGEPGYGMRYRITYDMSGRSSQFDAEITEFSPPTRFAAKLTERATGDGSNMDRYMVESYDVSQQRGRTRVVHQVNIHAPGINVFLRALIWLIMHAGHSTRQTYMEKFARLVEASAATGNQGSAGDRPAAIA